MTVLIVDNPAADRSYARWQILVWRVYKGKQVDQKYFSLWREGQSPLTCVASINSPIPFLTANRSCFMFLLLHWSPRRAGERNKTASSEKPRTAVAPWNRPRPRSGRRRGRGRRASRRRPMPSCERTSSSRSESDPQPSRHSPSLFVVIPLRLLHRELFSFPFLDKTWGSFLVQLQNGHTIFSFCFLPRGRDLDGLL